MVEVILDGGRVNVEEPTDVSIPLNFAGRQPNAYGVEPASSAACEYGELVGDTRRGGSCNFDRITLIPHCNGTHTECVGHITNERISVRDCLREAFVAALLISVTPCSPADTAESYSIPYAADDRLITFELLEKAISAEATDNKALIIRTMPNDDRKMTRSYDAENIPPFFTTEGVRYIVERGFKHLLVDLPSIDRLFDHGKLSNHRIFWSVEPASFETRENTRRENTITELIYVPTVVEDGAYLLNLQIAPFESDASPSRPILFKMKNS